MDEAAEPRAKRQKKDKFGRFAALQKLKGLKGSGSKHKYEVDQIDNVYEVVDEKEYTKKVLSRQDEDWIEDDDGSGYVEDGREIFDDDLDSESIAIAAASKGKGSKRKKKAVSENAGKGNLHHMLANMPAKKKEEAKVEDDDVLSELISELDSSSTSTSGAVKKGKASRFSLLDEKKAVNDYMKSFATSKPKARPVMKEIVDNNEEDVEVADVKNVEGEDKLEEEVEKIVEVAKPKLLFKIEQPKVAVKEEQESVLNDSHLEDVADLDFEDDFDFGNIEDFSEKKIPEITEEQLAEGCVFNLDNPEAAKECDDPADLPDLSQESDKEGFLFFWWDAYEDEKNKPGVILLFGKTYLEEQKKYVSCCVAVKNVQRKVFLLPRAFHRDEPNKPVSIMDVYQEATEVLKNANIKTYKSKKVTKLNAFDPNAPIESEYLEVRYDGYVNFANKEFNTFSQVYGQHSSFLEIFLLDRKIKGPCWLKASKHEISKNPWTHTAIEVVCDKPNQVTLLQSTKPAAPPPLTVLAINIKIASINNGSPEIAMISCLVHKRYHVDKKAPNPPFQEHFCVFTKLSNGRLPHDVHNAISKYKATKVQKIDSERGLLNYFIAQFTNIDPDLIVGHDLNGYQLSILGERLNKLSATNFSRLSRIRRLNTSYNKFRMERELFSGRLVCDMKITAKELIRSRSYDLESLCQVVLKVPEGQRIEIEPENVAKMYEFSQDLFKMISLTMQDTAYALKMMYELNVIPLALQITNIAGNVMSRTLQGGRAERNEFLLLHAFNEKDYIVPEKQIGKKVVVEEEGGSKRKKPTYSGGLVLDPLVGFYDKYILLMDFNSLYPSIIQEYNICFTTILITDTEVVIPEKSVPLGILPTEIRKLVDSRREVKKLMKNQDLSGDLMMQYHIRQMALKLTANSMYGCLGYSKSRFFAKNLAALVTQKGREILTNTRDIVQKLGHKVIYGDTDSIMIETNILDYNQVFKVGKGIKQEINKLYKQIELDIDGVFKYLLLLKKKKYAAVTVSLGKDGKLNEVQEIKGLDIVRRDWSQLAAQAGKHILNQILSDQTQDERIENIHSHLVKLKTDIEENKVPLSLLVITKQLTKDPSQYADKHAQPHVLVALRNNKTKGKKFKAGDTVPYIICNDNTNNSATQRAYLLEELKNSETLSIDTKYYLAQQIHPIVTRICEPIEGTDTYQIANLLGLDIAQFKKPVSSGGTSDLTYENFKKASIKFRNVDPFCFKCVSCKHENKLGYDLDGSLESCGNKECLMHPYLYIDTIKNYLVMTMRKYIQKYYLAEYMCEDPGCDPKTRKLPQRSVGKFSICVTCKQGVLYKVYNEEDLYKQLLYFQHIFDINKQERHFNNEKVVGAYLSLKESVDHVLRHSAYAEINLGELFAMFTPLKNHNVTLELDNISICVQDEEEDE